MKVKVFSSPNNAETEINRLYVINRYTRTSTAIIMTLSFIAGVFVERKITNYINRRLNNESENVES